MSYLVNASKNSDFLSPVLLCWSLLSFIFSEVARFMVLTSDFVMTFSPELSSLPSLFVGSFITESLVVEKLDPTLAGVGILPEMSKLNTYDNLKKQNGHLTLL